MTGEIREHYIRTPKDMTLFQAIHRIIRLQLKGHVADFGSAHGISGGKRPSIRVLDLE